MSVDKVRAHLLRLRNEGAYAALGQAAETFGSDDMAEERWTSRQVAIFLSHLQRQYAPTGALTFEAVLDEVLSAVGPPPGWVPPVAEAPPCTCRAHTFDSCANHPPRETCPICLHPANSHGPDGCWYTMTIARPEALMGCPCGMRRDDDPEAKP